MSLYALVEYNRVVQLKESEVILEPLASPTSVWVDVTGSTDIRVGRSATFNGVWTFSAPTKKNCETKPNSRSGNC